MKLKPSINKKPSAVQHYEAGLALLQANKVVQAQQKFHAAIIQDNYRGEVAEQAAVARLKTGSDNAEFLNDLGLCLLSNAKSEMALQVLTFAVKIKPDFSFAYANLARALHGQCELTLASTAFDNAIHVAKNQQERDVIRINRLNLLIDEGKFDLALAEVVELKQRHPQNTTLTALQGRIYQEQMKTAESIPYFEEVLRKDPNNLEVFINLTMAYIRHNVKDKAILFAKQTIDKLNNVYNFGGYGAIFPSLLTFLKFHDDSYLPPQAIIMDVENLDNAVADDNIAVTNIDNYRKLYHFKNVTVTDYEWKIYTDKHLYMNLMVVGMQETALGGNFHFGKIIVEEDELVPEDDVQLLKKHEYNQKLADMLGQTVETIEQQEVISLDKKGRKQVRLWDTTKLEGPHILLGGAENYYHWLVDFLPRVSMIEECPELKDLPVIVNHNFKSFQKRSLELVGFDTSRLVHSKAYHLIKSTDLYVPHLLGRQFEDYNMPAWMDPMLNAFVYKWLRQKFAPLMGLNPNTPRRIFISREGANFRKCVNESEIFAIAQKFGFEKLDNEKLTFDEQINTYANAEVVMGPHGAGFTNMVFAPQNATLIELLPKDRAPRFFKKLCEAIGQNHYSIDGYMAQKIARMPRDFWNFEIDAKEFESKLQQWLP